ncbi:MAG: porin family protein [Chryseolinea sp.]
MKEFLFAVSVAVMIGLVIVRPCDGQIIRAGFKAGPQLSWFKSDDQKYSPIADIHPVVGFHAGAVVAFKVKDRYFLTTELIYSQKGKIATGKVDPNLKDKVTYHHADLPILFSYHLKGRILKTRDFKWYVSAGPNISYWIGGKGGVKSGDLSENGIPELKYRIKFGVRPGNYDADILYIRDAQRFQFGMNVGAGLVLEPGGNRKVIIDLRYEIGHTRVGTPQSSQFLVPADYQDNLKGRNKGLRLSVAYLLEYSTKSSDINKGKSATKQKN